MDTDRVTGAESTRRREGQDGPGQRAEGPRSGAHRVPPSPEVPKEPPRFRGQRAQSSTAEPGSHPGRPPAQPPSDFSVELGRTARAGVRGAVMASGLWGRPHLVREVLGRAHQVVLSHGGGGRLSWQVLGARACCGLHRKYRAAGLAEPRLL